jgi:predicted MFS family arabinose efflux permease
VQPLSRNRDFVLLWVGQTLSALGSQMSSLAYPLLALALTHSPAKAGVVVFAASAPYTIFVLPAGVLVDRWNRRRVMVTADLARATALGVLALLLATARPSYLVVAAVAFAESAFDAFFNIAETGAVRQVVPAAQLPEAIAREQSRIYAALVGGPPLGGLLFGLSRLLPFVADAASYAFSVVTLLAMRTPFQEERAEPRARARDELVEGLRWLWEHTFLRTCAVMFAAGNFAGSGLFLAIVVIARRQGLSSAAIGVLMASFGVAGIVGSVIAPWLQRRLSVRTIVVGNQWLAVGLLAFVVAPNVWVLLAAFAVYALFNPTLNAVVVGYRIALTPDRLVGRVNSVARFIAQIVTPLGPLATGVLLGTLSGRVTIGLLAAWLIAIAVWISFSRSIAAAPSLDDISGTGPAPAA